MIVNLDWINIFTSAVKPRKWPFRKLIFQGVNFIWTALDDADWLSVAQKSGSNFAAQSFDAFSWVRERRVCLKRRRLVKRWFSWNLNSEYATNENLLRRKKTILVSKLDRIKKTLVEQKMDPKLSFILIFCFFCKLGGATLSDSNTNLNQILLETLSTSQVTI